MLRDRKNIVRLILFILAAGIAVGAFTSGVVRIGHKESGYHAVDYTAQGKATLYASGVHLQYFAQGESGEIKQTLNEVQKLYTDLLLRAYMLLDDEQTYDDCPNIASLNASPGEWIDLDADLIAVLEDALARTGRGEGYSLFSGALHREWQQLRYLEDATGFDPLNNADEKRLLAELAAQISAPETFSLEIREGQARFTVGDAYTAWARENEIEAPILSLNLLHDAYLLQLTARGLCARGYTAGYLYTDSGLSLLTAPTGEMAYALPSMEDKETGEAVLPSPSAWCAFTAFAPAGVEYGYYTVKQEDTVYLRHPYVNILTGDFADLILTAALGGKAESIIDIAWYMARLNCLSSLEEAKNFLSVLPEDVVCAFTLQRDPENCLYTSEANTDRLRLNESIVLTVWQRR